MTPIPKHIEEAQRLARLCAEKLYESAEKTEKPWSDIMVDELNLPALLAAQEELEKLQKKRRCEHCGSDRIYVGPPNCPGCGAPNCCQTCCEATSLEKERDQLRAERDEWKQICANRDATVKEQGDEWVKLKTEIETLRTHNAALLAVIRATNKAELDNALSALEPLGIKV